MRIDSEEEVDETQRKMKRTARRGTEKYKTQRRRMFIDVH